MYRICRIYKNAHATRRGLKRRDCTVLDHPVQPGPWKDVSEGLLTNLVVACPWVCHVDGPCSTTRERHLRSIMDLVLLWIQFARGAVEG